ncbi:Peroxidase 29 [Nymphaea thermarum]|nr:Peroxidase 29 [Nymphaea thermarum]
MGPPTSQSRPKPKGWGEGERASTLHRLASAHDLAQLDTLVSKAMAPIFSDVTAAAAFVRLMFHDCQVQGCDASILLDSVGNRNIISEMVSDRNFGIRKRGSIQLIKEVVESECPGKVSCADLIIMAASKSVAVSGGPLIRILLGRKDSTTANNLLADHFLPRSHTLGAGHCVNIVDRLYEPKEDDFMSNTFNLYLRFLCPDKMPLTNLTALPNDLTPILFDNQYFRDILAGRGPFTIDSRIASDQRTSSIVAAFANDQEFFLQTFSSAFSKLSTNGVLTGNNGEVRRKCNQTN